MTRRVGIAIVLLMTLLGSSGLAWFSAAAPVRAQASFEVLELGLPDGYTMAAPADLNDQGWVLVNASNDEGERAFLFRDGTFVQLGTEDEVAVGSALNEEGMAAGWALAPTDGTGESQPRGVLLTPDLTIELITNGFESRAHGLNDQGEPVGEARVTETAVSHQPVFWTADGMGVLAGPEGETAGVARDVNVIGQIVGWTGTTAESEAGRATLWQEGAPLDLGTLGGDWSDALAINDNGVVVGVSTTDSGQMSVAADGTAAFVWADGTMHQLEAADGQIWSQAVDLNSTEMIVGSIRIEGRDEPLAAIWTSRSISLLNDLIAPDAGFDLTEAVAVNELGQIVCVALDESGAQTMVLLTVLGN